MKKTLAFLSSVLMFFAAASASEPAQFNVATYNIRLPASSDSVAGNGWAQRGKILARLAFFNDFDIFGTQEGYKFQLDDIVAEMPGFAYTGAGREDGRHGGEHSAIVYDTALFDLLDSGDFWLAEDTTYPHKGWDAACVRICSWGRFRHKASGKEFIFMNLHMDHIGTVARNESARLVVKKIAEIGHGLPAFVTGDFNVDQTSDAYATITGDGRLLDAFKISDFVFAPNGTFNGWHSDGFSNQRIDHIFVTPGIRVLKYGIITDTYRTADGSDGVLEANDAPEIIRVKKATVRTPSDHFPVKAKITLP